MDSFRRTGERILATLNDLQAIREGCSEYETFLRRLRGVEHYNWSASQRELGIRLVTRYDLRVKSATWGY